MGVPRMYLIPGKQGSYTIMEYLAQGARSL